MNLWLLLGIVVLILICSFFYRNKIVIHFKTFFRKGFKLKKDKYGVFCFTGKQGSGKTYSAVDFISCIHMKNKKVITNVYSYYLSDKNNIIYEPDFYKIIKGFKNHLYTKDYIIFYDEIFTLLAKGKLDRSILSFISQLRKRSIYLITTAQEWLEINVTFRRYVRYQIDCKLVNLPFLGGVSINEINDGYNMQWDKDQNEYLAPRLRTTFKKCSLKIADSYDTFEVVQDG